MGALINSGCQYPYSKQIVANSSCMLRSSPISHLGSGHRAAFFRERRGSSPRKIGDLLCEEREGLGGGPVRNRRMWCCALHGMGQRFLGIFVSFLRPATLSMSMLAKVKVEDGLGSVTNRAQVVEGIKQDFDQPYFITGTT